MKPVVLTKQAAAELAQERGFYDRQRPRLGTEFVAEFRRAAGYIAEYPRAAPELTRGYRRKMLRRFPHGVVYQERDESILVVAVWNSSRDPKHLSSRLR